MLKIKNKKIIQKEMQKKIISDGDRTRAFKMKVYMIIDYACHIISAIEFNNIENVKMPIFQVLTMFLSKKNNSGNRFLT